MARPIGFSTGCLHWLDEPLIDVVRLIRDVGSDAVELHLGHGRLFDCEPSKELAELLNAFHLVTVHAPNGAYGDEEGDVFDRLRLLCEGLPVDCVVVHPDNISDFSLLEQSPVPFVIENMDKRKEAFQFPDEFDSLNADFDFGYVLDAQHVYEHDSSMRLGDAFVEKFGVRLRYLHVSGQTSSNNHEAVISSDNKEMICSFVKRTSAPIIFEGVLPREGTLEAMKRELALFR